MATVGFTHSVQTGYKSDAGTINTTLESFLGNAQEDIDVLVPATTVDMHIPLAITAANIVSMTMFGAEALSVSVNAASTGSPQETIALVKGTQLIWTSTSGHALPFSGDVTGFFVSNAGALASRFRVAVLLSN